MNAEKNRSVRAFNATSMSASNIARRIFTQRPLPLPWVFVIAYLLISPMALLIPSDVFARFPWTRTFTDTVAAWVPMIDRVVAYGHPHPDKLRCFLAYAWSCVPVLVWLIYGTQNKYNKPQAWGPGPFEFWLRWLPATGLVLGLLWGMAYWPNFPVGGKEMLDPIVRPHDERRQLFWSTTSLFLYIPLGICLYAGIVDVLRCELANLLWRLGLLKSYPTLSTSNDLTPSSETNHG